MTIDNLKVNLKRKTTVGAKNSRETKDLTILCLLADPVAAAAGPIVIVVAVTFRNMK